MKVLSPAGNFECLRAAVFSGADEVYIGINQFNARNNIDGFTMENLQDAVDFAHLYGVKILLAINILFTDEEIQSAFDTVVKAYNIGVDAFIVQDLGLMSIIYSHYPQIELHASTQMGLHNLEGVMQVAKYGVKRVVLARETPLDEIKRIKDNINIEIEYFAHGALCVCFSGNCYMSSYLFGASGNRGRCKQLCRLPYTLLDGEKEVKKGYLLSAKDFNMLSRLNDLKNAGVDVLKIEGRARRPFYVATVTELYKRALAGEKIDDTDVELAFNRGFTEGYFNGNGNIISPLQNHIGVKVGRVERVKNGKNFNEIYITSDFELSPKSTFKFFNGNKESNTLTAYDLRKEGSRNYRITTTQKVSVGDTVRLIVDAIKEEKVKEQTLKRQVNMAIEASENKPILAKIFLENKEYVVEGDVCLTAQKQPLTVNEIESNFTKSQIFSANVKVNVLGNVFLPKQRLNEFRRKTFDYIYNVITEKYRKNLPCITIERATRNTAFNDYEIIENLPLKEAKNIIFSPSEYTVDEVKAVQTQCQKMGVKLYLDTPNFALLSDVELIGKIIKETGVAIVANNYYALAFDCEKVAGFGLNVYNNYTANQLQTPYISAENSDEFIPPFMTLRHCPVKSHVGGNCNKCSYKEGLFYKIEGGRKFLLKRKKLSTCTFYLI